MTRLDIVLGIFVIASALGVVSSQHRARSLYAELERQEVRTGSLEAEWEQLQVEHSKQAQLARVERKARDELGMQPPETSRVVVVGP